VPYVNFRTAWRPCSDASRLRAAPLLHKARLSARAIPGANGGG